MTIEININGFFEMEFTDVLTGQVVTDEKRLVTILDNLQSGKYLFGISSMAVTDAITFNRLYTVELIPNGNGSNIYEFDEV